MDSVPPPTAVGKELTVGNTAQLFSNGRQAFASLFGDPVTRWLIRICVWVLIVAVTTWLLFELFNVDYDINISLNI